MDAQQLLERLTRELKRRGLPQEYIARYIAELSDHIADSMDAQLEKGMPIPHVARQSRAPVGRRTASAIQPSFVEERKSDMSKDALSNDPANFAEIAARIGDPSFLAEAASVEFARRSFCGRHPIVTFLLAPLPLAVLAWAAMFAASFGLLAGTATAAQWFYADRDVGVTIARWPTAVNWLFATLFVLSVTAPPATLTVLLCRLANRSGLSWRWSLAACLMLAIVAGMFQASLDPPAMPGEGDGRLTLGFGLWALPPLTQVLQFALPLLIGLGLIWRRLHPRDGDQHGAPQAITPNQQAA